MIRMLAPSSLPAPSAASFDFTPPTAVPRTSWKTLPHFSPTYGSTPITTNHLIITDDDTPTCEAALEAAAPKPKDRYLRSANIAALAPSTPESTSSSSHTPFPTTPAPQAEVDHAVAPKSSAPEHRIFEFEYDTFTRDHLAALVEEIDGLGSGERTVEKTQVELDQAWETSFVELPPLEMDQLDDDLDDDAGRSSKRIRLSPDGPRSVSVTPASSRQRRTASRAGTTERAGIRVPSASGSYRRRQRDRSYDSSLASDAISPTSSTKSFARSASHASIRSNVSTRFVDGRPATVGAPARTRDRLGEANALMDRIRARTVEQEKQAMVAERDEDEEPTLTATPQARSSGSTIKVVSPRKLLRRLSSSLEVDAESPQLSSKFSETGSESTRNQIELSVESEQGENVTLPLLAAAASASIRNSLSPVKLHSSVMLSPSTVFPQPLSPARRHFARTPLSTPSTRRNRTSSAAFDVPPGEDIWGARKASEEASVGTSSTNTLLATPGGHARISAITTIGPNDAEKLLSGTPSRMFFDTEQNKWIKLSKSAANELRSSGEASEGGEMVEEGNSTEEDPFRDFDSLRISEEDTSNQSSSGLAALSRLSGLGITSSGRKVTPEVPVIEVVEEISREIREQYERGVEPLERVEEEVTADFDNSVEVGFDTEEETGDLEREQKEESPFHLYRAMGSAEEELAETEDEEEDPTVRIATVSILPPDIATPIALRKQPATSSPTSSPRVDPPTTPRAVSLSPTLIPRSALKPAGRTQSDPALATPDRLSTFSSPRSTRSVSFSDGKTTGKMEGQVVQEFGRDGKMGSKLKFEIPVVGDGSGFSPVSRDEIDALDQELEREFAEDETISQGARISFSSQ